MNYLKIKYSAISLILALTIGGQVEAKKDVVNSIKIESSNVYTEEAQAIEAWMFEALKPVQELTFLEGWMFNELVPAEEVLSFEAWMFDTDYFKNN